jgi:hypothetical protein
MQNKVNYEKTKKVTHILRLFSQICFWGSIAGAALTAVIALILIIFPNVYSFFMTPMNLFKNGSLAIELNDMLRYSFNSNQAMNINMEPAFFSIIIRTSICGAIMAPFFYQLSLILKSAEKDNPFEVKNARRLTIMGILLIANSIVYRIGDYVILHSILKVVDLPNLSINYTFNMNGLLMGVLLFILAGIFRHGSYLQEEYDTTL